MMNRVYMHDYHHHQSCVNVEMSLANCRVCPAGSQRSGGGGRGSSPMGREGSRSRGGGGSRGQRMPPMGGPPPQGPPNMGQQRPPMQGESKLFLCSVPYQIVKEFGC